MIDQDSPATRSDAAAYMADERAMVATLLGGTGAMRAAGKKYLPKHPAESDEGYAYRLAVSTLYNGMRRTVSTLSGKPFAEPIKLGDDIPPAVQEWCADIDLQGRDLHAFAHSVFQGALADGIAHILVDYPRTAPGASLADKTATGARPYFVHVKHDQVLGWRAERIAGVETLTQLRLMEQVEEPAGPWGVRCIEQIRVLEPTAWTTYRKDAKDVWQPHESGVVTLGAIPLATIYTGREGFMRARPPLLDLAWLNLEHWQSSSDQSNILHVARVPILFASGFVEGALKIGAGSAVTNDDPTAKLQYVEHTGAAIEAGRVSIKDLEERMSLMGAQLLVRKEPGQRTATEASIDSAESESELALMVRTCEDSIERALQFAADWEDVGPAGTVAIVGEVESPDDMDVPSLILAVEKRILSAETVFTELQRRGRVSDELTWEIESARLAAQPVLAEPGAADAGAQPGAVPAGPPAAPPAPDFGPLLTSIGALVAALDKPPAEPAAPAPLDLSPLVEAIRAQPAPIAPAPPDMTPIASAIASLAAAVAKPAPAVDYTPLIAAIAALPAPQIAAPPDLSPILAALVDRPPPDLSPLVAAIAAMKPPTTVFQRASSVEFTLDADGNPVGAKLN